MRHRLLPGLLAAAVLLAGCSASSDPAEPGVQPVRVEVTIADGSVEPSGERVDVRAGQPVELVVSSDTDGELHVHSDPEQSIEIHPGEIEETITIDRPGVVEVELHGADVVVVQLEVR